MIDKKVLVTEIINQLTIELHKAELAAEQAKNAATDDQSVAETQYDTLAIEASYLAEGQSRRVQEFKQSINAYKVLSTEQVNTEQSIKIGCLVQLAADESSHSWFFIGPAAGGFRAIIGEQHITVVTKQSPMGKTLMGKYLHDEVGIKVGPITLNDEIIQVI
jgi:transcription elongation GreA/GreB family factor